MNPYKEYIYKQAQTQINTNKGFKGKLVPGLAATAVIGTPLLALNYINKKKEEKENNQRLYEKSLADNAKNEYLKHKLSLPSTRRDLDRFKKLHSNLDNLTEKQYVDYQGLQSELEDLGLISEKGWNDYNYHYDNLISR